MLRRDENVRGVAIFAPLHRNTPIILSFPFPLPNQACYAPHLQLLPLLHAQAALVHCLVLALDYEHARWGEWWCNHLRWLGEEKMKIPRHHRTGGWSAERFARHRVMGHLRPFLRKVGVRTTRLVKTGEPWLLVGNKKVHSLFAALLPRQVKKLLLGRLSLDLDSPLPETRRKISAFLAAKQKAENQCLVKLLVRQEHKLSVLGTSAVLRALQEHRLPLLVLTFGVTMRGYFCANCGWLDTSQPRCAVCAQPMIATDDLIEHIAAYALAHDVQIRWVPPHAAFLARGGIGGFLRPLPSTLL
jgi:peptide subunit release factor 1 (eRF1)